MIVNQQTPIAILVPRDLELVVDVEEAQLGQIAIGQMVQLQVAAYPDQTFAGAVRSISPMLDSHSRTAAVRIEPQDTGDRLRAGMFAKVRIVTAAREGVLMLPREALVDELRSTQGLVLVIDDERTIRRTPVRLGSSVQEWLSW
jgi:membrane fusion protein (multidrug efflux system)